MIAVFFQPYFYPPTRSSDLRSFIAMIFSDNFLSTCRHRPQDKWGSCKRLVRSLPFFYVLDDPSIWHLHIVSRAYLRSYSIQVRVDLNKKKCG